MTTKIHTFPKAIKSLLDQEAELHESAAKYSVTAFRARRDELALLINSGNATPQDIEDHSNYRDGGQLEADCRAREATLAAAADGFRKKNWPVMLEYLKTRYQARLDREAALAAEVERLKAEYGVFIEIRDDSYSTTQQLASLIEREDGWIFNFNSSASIY